MSPALLSPGPGFLGNIAEPAARSLVLACLAGVAVFVLRVRAVSWKTAIWRAVLVAALVMPLLGLLLPPLRLPVPVLGVKTHSAAARVTETTPIILPTRTIVVSPDDAAFEKYTPLAREPRSLAWIAILASIYLAIAFGLMARIFVGAAFGNRLVRHSTPVRDVSALRQLSLLAHRAGLRAQPLLAESDVLAVPVTLRVRHPAVLLPVSWNEWGAAKLSAVLAHEVSHVARHDALVQRFALIHRAVFWFSPLGWWLVRYLDDLAEQVSDEAVLACGIERTQYAEALLGFVATLQDCRARVWWEGVAMAKRGCAEKRLERILAWRSAMPNELRKSVLIGLAMLAVPVVALTASVRPTLFNLLQSTAPVAPAPAAPSTAPEPKPAVAPVRNASPVPKAPPSVPTLAMASEPSVRPIVNVTPAPGTPTVAPAARFAAVAPSPGTPMDAMVAPSVPAAPAVALTPPPPAARVAGQAGGVSAGVSGGVSGGASGGVYDRGAYGGVAYGGRAYSEAHSDSGPRFVIITKGSSGVIMSGSSEDVEHAKLLGSKINGNFIWFEHDEKPYVIRDQATVQRAKQFWQRVEDDLGRQQEALGQQQALLGQTENNIGRQVDQVRVKIPDLSAQMEQLAEQIKQLSASGGTVEQIGDLQSRIGELQSHLEEAESEAGRHQADIGREQAELSNRQAALGRQEAEIGRRQAELSRQASQQMKQLLDDAITRGLAQPE